MADESNVRELKDDVAACPQLVQSVPPRTRIPPRLRAAISPVGIMAKTRKTS